MKKLIVFAIATVCIVLVIRFPHTMISPGELISGHTKFQNDCFQCHKVLGGIDNSKCTRCHKPTEIDSKSNVTNQRLSGFIHFHDKLRIQSCTSCHTDHKGIHAATSLHNFKHDLLTQSIKEDCKICHTRPADFMHKQLSENCVSCHNTNSWKSNMEFNHDMIQNVNKDKCFLCHKAPIDSFHKLSQESCGKCHSTAKWVPSSFNHATYFVLDEDHNVACIKCHDKGNYTTYTCYGCHEHSESSIRGEHLEEGISNFTNCASCHASGDEHNIRQNDAERGIRANENEKEDKDD